LTLPCAARPISSTADSQTLRRRLGEPTAFLEDGAMRLREASTTSAGAVSRAAGVEGRRGRVFEIERDRLGDRLRQREIDSRGHAAASHQVAVAHDPRMDRDRAKAREQVVRRPMGSRALAPKQAAVPSTSAPVHTEVTKRAPSACRFMKASVVSSAMSAFTPAPQRRRVLRHAAVRSLRG
jgi:hypothetical protein